MFTLFRKEIIQFLGSVTGYLAILTFLVVSGLFLWVFPGDFNIPESGYSSLEPFFLLAPWLYLFLIPAITMRSFSEERRSGTLELLLTRPVGDFHIVWAKFFAALVLVAFSLIPALIYFYSVYQLGTPAGKPDAGSTWGSFMGLFLLASVYIAIGLFSSVFTESQIIAFITSALLSFVCYLGFGFLAGSGIPYIPGKILTGLSIREHYLSVSRGIIDMKDALYFLCMTWLFLLGTVTMLRRSRMMSWRGWRWALGTVTGFLAVWILAGHLILRIDLTADRRFSLQTVTKKVAESIDEPVTIELFLDGELPPGFRKLQSAIIDKVKDISRYAHVPLHLVITDPSAVTTAANREDFVRELSRQGVNPTDLRQKTDRGMVTTLVFPGAVITKGSLLKGVNFLKNNPGLNHEVNLNHSIESVEYELVSALKLLMAKEKPEVVFLQGNGELDRLEVEDLTVALSENFTISFEDPEKVWARESYPDILVIAAPEEPFSETRKFILDQMVMKGSRLLWLLDPVKVSLDSLSQGFMTLAFPRDLNLNDLLFHYGVRINSDLVQDAVCARILVNTSRRADRPEFTPQNWYYSPLLTPSENHPVSRNLNLLYSEFVSSVDTVGSSDPALRTTLLLSTSPYGRVVRTPAIVSLESINAPPARELFDKPSIPTGVLLEGEFTSGFKNRMLNALTIPVQGLLEKSPATKMMLFSDGNLIANKVRYSGSGEAEILPLGYDRVSRQTYGNKEFFMNALQYLADNEGIMQLRNASLKLRLLDKVRLREEGRFWKWFNVVAPTGLVLLFALIFNLIRKRKYSIHKS